MLCIESHCYLFAFDDYIHSFADVMNSILRFTHLTLIIEFYILLQAFKDCQSAKNKGEPSKTIILLSSSKMGRLLTLEHNPCFDCHNK